MLPLNDLLVRPTILSQKPPYHSALLGTKCQVTLWYLNASLSASDSSNPGRSYTTTREVKALLDITVEGRDFLLENL